MDYRSLRTTICAMIGCLAGFVAFTPEAFPHIVVELAKYIMLGGFTAVGIFAKDVTDHSTVAEVAESTAERSQAPLALSLPLPPPPPPSSSKHQW